MSKAACERSGGLLSSLSSLEGALPDERPLLSLQIVDSVAKCPAGYWPVSRTYDEDSDAGLLRQSGLFGKKPTHYICLSKSEGVPGYVMDGLAVVGEREAPPAGYGVAGRAGKRRLCTRVSRRAAVASAAPAAAASPVTDVIVCSRMRQAPQGFLLAGEINGKMVCYKLGGAGAEDSPTADNSYENVVSNYTPEAAGRLRAAPERPPKSSPLVNELNNLNPKRLSCIDDFNTCHDYEALSTSYNIKPSRPAPRPPTNSPSTPLSNRNSTGLLSPTPPGRHKKGPAPLPRVSNYNTLGNYNGLEGVPFVLNPKLVAPGDAAGQLPVIKRRSVMELEREFSYNFSVERQT